MNKQELAEQIAIAKKSYKTNTYKSYRECFEAGIAAIVEAMDAPAKEGLCPQQSKEEVLKKQMFKYCKDDMPENPEDSFNEFINDAIGKAILEAMKEYAQQFQQSAPAKEGIKWVKASEPPEPDRRVLMKYNDGQRLEFGCYVKNVWTGNKFGYLDEQDEQPSQCYPDYWVYPEWLDESAPAKEVEAISDSEDYRSGVNTFIGKGLTGWQVGFSIGCQTFYLQPNLVEERGTKEWAEWLEKCLKTAFSKMEVHGIKEAAKEAISVPAQHGANTHYHVADNSNGFRDWLDKKKIEYTPNGHFTSILLEGNDIFKLGSEFAMYKQQAMCKSVAQPIQPSLEESSTTKQEDQP